MVQSSIVQLAMSTPDYPATPGDIYSLAYIAGTQPVSAIITLDAGYKLKVHNLGTLNAEGKTFLQLKSEVENLVSKNYPLSGVQFSLITPGVFTVLLNGEILNAGQRKANGLTRLSNLLSAEVSPETKSTATRLFPATGFTPKASVRNVTITSADGKIKTYDLFVSQRTGDLKMDPYLRPGDIVTIPASERIVTLAGQVFRPGTYELKDGEELSRLIEYYGDGFTLLADPSRIVITRVNSEIPFPGKSIQLVYADNSDELLYNGDIILVKDKRDVRSSVFFEGAISAKGNLIIDETSAALEGTAKMFYPFYAGETLGNAVHAIRDQFYSSSDLENAYILRNGRHIPADLRRFLYLNDFSGDVLLENGDVIIVPFRQFFVLVSGAVKAPGRYPYVPDRTMQYYLNLAGGIDQSLNNGRGIIIMDLNDKLILADSFIPPEAKITVPLNKFAYHFNQYGPIITTILSIFSTTLSVLAVTGVLK